MARPSAPRLASLRRLGDRLAHPQTIDTETPRERWLSASILAGFAGTIIMSLLLVVAYVIAGWLAEANGNLVGRWFWGLTHNDLTDGIFDIPIAALSINLIAGLFWALVYGGLVEPRLSGPGWWRGMFFSLVPWVLSLVVFLPIVGAGFFGSDLNAGPLPALGNLLLHLAYGATLGTVYALPELSATDTELDRAAAKRENDSMAFGLVAGLAAGLVVGAIVAALATEDITDALNLTLAGGGLGAVLGGLIGSFIGIDLGTREPV